MIVIKDRYQFNPQSAIGRGSFSKVYEGVDLLTNTRVAVKKIDLQRAGDKSRQRIEREIKLSQELVNINHPNIVKIYAIDSDANYVYIIMEFCAGGDFAKFLSRSDISGEFPVSNSDRVANPKIKETKVRYYIHQLMMGLHYLYEKNILHRDLKPANLLLTDDNKTLKIADFGFALHVNDTDLATTLCGSPLYMAPEVLAEEPYTRKSDLWSVGMILYQCLYGRLPYEDAVNHIDLLRLIKTRSVSYPKNIHLSHECIDLLHGLLQKDSNLRITWPEFFLHSWFEWQSAHSNLFRPRALSETSISRIPVTGSYKTESQRIATESQRNRSGGITESPPAPPSLYQDFEEVRAIQIQPRVTPLSISFSPNIIDSYIPSESPPTIHSDGGIMARPVVLQSPSITKETLSWHRGSRGSSAGSRSGSMSLAPVTENNEGSVSYIWSFLSSSLKSFSIFKSNN